MSPTLDDYKSYITKIFVPNVKCYWCGSLIPVIGTQPKHCPYCGGKL